VWWTGNDRESLRGAANIADESAIRAGENWPDAEDWKGFDDGFPIHSPVGSFRPNPFGLYDVHGNVWEWCLDVYGPYSMPVRDGDGLRLIASGDSRVDRNGDYMSKATYARSAFRDHVSADYRYYNLGVRPARAIEN
jgi:formylglycine-generating enzyme required for sulfatase activity